MSNHFEGTEKRVEIKFSFLNVNQSRLDLFSVPIDEIKARVLSVISCAVLDEVLLDDIHAYLLSESSLFVLKDKIMLKTCGLTTLISGVAPLLELIEEKIEGIEVEYVVYTRRNFLFPTEQRTPHRSWQVEVDLLRKIFPDAVTTTIGVTDTFHVLLVDRRPEDSESVIQFTEVAMRNLDQDAMSKFFKKEDISHADYMEYSGLSSILPEDFVHNGFIFEPCGYSSNSVKDETYYTIHITPENGFSYVSYETNNEGTKEQNISGEYRSELYRQVTEYFKPGESSLSIIADTHLLNGFPFETHAISSRVSLAFVEDING